MKPLDLKGIPAASPSSKPMLPRPTMQRRRRRWPYQSRLRIITEPSTADLASHSSVHQTYLQQMDSLIYVYVGGVNQIPFEPNLICLCREYTDEVTLRLTQPAESTSKLFASPIDSLLYLYYRLDCNYLSAMHPHKQCMRSASKRPPNLDGAVFVKSLYEQFCKDHQRIHHSMVPPHQHSSHDLCISFIHFLLNTPMSHTPNSSQKNKCNECRQWQFAYYFVRYLAHHSIAIRVERRHSLIPNHMNASQETKSLGFRLFTTICQAFNLKMGPFSATKSKLTAWCRQTFAPTIFGWWHYLNPTISRTWIPLSVELKQHVFHQLNEAWYNYQKTVKTVDFQFMFVTQNNLSMFTEKTLNQYTLISCDMSLIQTNENNELILSSSDVDDQDIYKTQSKQVRKRNVVKYHSPKSAHQFFVSFIETIVQQFVHDDDGEDNHCLVNPADIMQLIATYLIPLRESSQSGFNQSLHTKLSQRRIPSSPLSFLLNVYPLPLIKNIDLNGEFDKMYSCIADISRSLQCDILKRTDSVCDKMKSIKFRTIDNEEYTPSGDVVLWLMAILGQYGNDVDVLNLLSNDKLTSQCSTTQIIISLFRHLIMATKWDRNTSRFLFSLLCHVRQSEINAQTFQQQFPSAFAMFKAKLSASLLQAVSAWYQTYIR